MLWMVLNRTHALETNTTFNTGLVSAYLPVLLEQLLEWRKVCRDNSLQSLSFYRRKVMPALMLCIKSPTFFEDITVRARKKKPRLYSSILRDMFK
jgi:hypothetical protein